MFRSSYEMLVTVKPHVVIENRRHYIFPSFLKSVQNSLSRGQARGSGFHEDVARRGEGGTQHCGGCDELVTMLCRWGLSMLNFNFFFFFGNIYTQPCIHMHTYIFLHDI